MDTRHGFLAGIGVLCLGGLAIADGPTIVHHSGSSPSHSSPSHSTPSHSTHSSASGARPSHHERRERAWRDWYYRHHHRYIRPGYYYPGGYPPGYSDSDPTPTSSSPGTYVPAQNGVDNKTPRSTNSGTSDAQPASAQVDPDLQIELDRVKKACASRSDYVAAVADKKDAEEKLAELYKHGGDNLETTVPLATRVMNAKKLITAIEREETARFAKESRPQTQPAAPVTN